jgi:hypothetical protein
MMKKLIILFIALSIISAYQVLADDNDIDNLLRDKWNLMTSYLKQGNEEKALELIHPFERKDYAIMFQALRGQMPQIMATQIELRRKKIEDNNAKYDLITKEDTGTYSYEVLFVRDQKGTWYIYSF